MSERKKILLTGATGYIGGRLLPLLEVHGHKVRCLARHPENLRDKVGPDTEVVQGDVLVASTLPPAFEGVHTAYYLVHSMGETGKFDEQERESARNFATAARIAGVQKIVYLGGLGGGKKLSEHLASRQAVGTILRESGVPTIEFRSSIVIGSGSLSFQMIRSLVEKLPVMITPKWVSTRTQPISVEDVLAYLLEVLDHEFDRSRVYQIGGADRVSYLDIMREYAKRRGLRRLMIPVPFLSPRLSSLWLGLVTPLYAQVGRKLIDGLRNETVVTDERAYRVFSVRPRGIAEAIDRALRNEDRRFAATSWSDAVSSLAEGKRYGGLKLGRRIVDSRSRVVACPPEQAFAPIARIGGKTGWYAANFLWSLRGFVDRLVGGPGTRRGRRHPTDLRVGDALDFWRVEAFQPGRKLRLRAEMRVPGRAWLQFDVEAHEGGAEIRQTAIFDPAGVFGWAYWYALYPLHAIVFRRMLSGIARAATSEKKNGTASVWTGETPRTKIQT